jgi:TonB-dependent SusC/RagA subfamily outer membrane receptor
MKKIIIILIGLSLTLSLSAQHRVVYGTVNVFGDMTLKNIAVSAKNAGTETRTDSLGNFAIVCNQKDVLQFKAKTFCTVKKRVKPSIDTVNVQMRFIEGPDNVELAIGYGYITKDKATFAQSMLNNKREDFCSYSNIFDLINGKCPGVIVNNTSNFPGSEQEIIIRGKNSINLSSCALYVVDGIVVSHIGDLSPCDVKSINFLKDASASIYGSRGGNGVVLIETVGANRNPEQTN